jgi:LPXTG-site transpeptidase (sortase) family protein
MKTKSIIGILIFIALLCAGYYFLISSKSNSLDHAIITPTHVFGWKFPVTKFPLTGSVGNQVAYSKLPNPNATPQGLPIRLLIPIIGVDSAIEDALITSDGRMDVPANSVNVAWFALGPKPGQVGSAVIGGHFGIQNGVPFVFYDLNKLKVGDKIQVVNDENVTTTFIVRSIQSFNENADATTVFTSTDGLAHLNLITCEGVWNEVNGSYPDRLVIFADKENI